MTIRTVRRAESDIEMIARLNREHADLRTTLLGRMAPLARLDIPLFQGRAAGAQSLTSGVVTPIVLDAASTIDTHGAHSTTSSPTRWTCPTGWAGRYAVSGRILINTAVTNQVITCSIGHNGVNLGYTQVNVWGNNDYSASTGSTYVTVAEGDYLELFAAQFSGSSRSTVGEQCTLAIAFERR